MREWRKKRIEQGYGKAIYARRKARYDNETGLRQTLVALDTLLIEGSTPATLRRVIDEALHRYPPVTGKTLDYMPQGEEDEADHSQEERTA